MPKREPVEVTKCVLYARVSTEEQKKTGHGVEAQLVRCRAYAVARGLAVVAEFRELARSGGGEATRTRPALLAALAAVEGNPDTCIVAFSLSRLSRSMQLTSDLLFNDDESKQVHFCSVTEPFDTTTTTGQMMMAVCAAFARYERMLARERTVAGQDNARRKGSQFGQKKLCDVAPEKVALVRRLHAEGRTVRGVADELNRLGETTKHGKPWGKTQVFRTLKQQHKAIDSHESEAP